MCHIAAPVKLAQYRKSKCNSPRQSRLVHFKAPALDDTLAHAQDPGSTVYLPPMDLPGDYGRIAVVSDPDGNPVGPWA